MKKKVDITEVKSPKGKKRQESITDGKLKTIDEENTQNGTAGKSKEIPLKERKKNKVEGRSDGDKIEEQTNRKELFSSTDSILSKGSRNIKRRYETWFQSLKKRVIKIFDHPWLPSRKAFAHWIALILVGFTLWGIGYSVAGTGFVPGTQLFSLAVLFVLAYIAGEITKLIKLPPLLGMLLMGIFLRNIKFIHVTGVFLEVTASLREIALCVILTRAGLGLDPKAMKSLSWVILRLATIPAFVEGTFTMILSHYLLDLPWMWGILLGSVLAAVSPAVVIPCLFSLQERGYGKDKGVPTLVVAAASLDDIVAISAFGVVISMIFSSGDNLAMQIAQGPLGLLIGVTFGVIWGFIAHFIPHKKDESVILLRVMMIAGGGLMAIFGSGVIGYQGAGPLGCIVAPFVACLGWRKEGWTDGHNPVADVFSVIWTVFQPILFGLIGSEVDIFVLEGNTVGYGVLTLLICLFARIVVSVFVAFGANFNWKEKIFVAWAWFPKATVQAALGPVALDLARHNGLPDEIQHASKILIIAVLAILITAPIGSIIITLLGPKLLTKVDVANGRTITKEENEVTLEAKEDEKPLELCSPNRT